MPHSEDAAGSTDGAKLDVSPRQRLLEGLADSIAEVGYQETTVADIVRRAKTSRRTFYDHFPDREACLIALLTATHLRAIAVIAKGVDSSAPWESQVRQAVEAWIAYAESQSPVILSWIREAQALGPGARRFKDEVNEAYIKLIQSTSSNPALRAAGHQKVPRSRAIIFIGGLRELVAVTVERGGRLRDINEDAVDAAVLLFS